MGRLADRLKHKYGTHPHIELYDRDRFFTFTGQRLPDYPASVMDRHDELLALHRHLHEVESQKRRAATPSAVAPVIGPPPLLSEAELLGRALAARNGAKFARLWGGDTSGYRSPSECDCALAAMLLFWTGGDMARATALMRQSGLMRK